MQRFPQPDDSQGQRSYTVKGLFLRAISGFKPDVASATSDPIEQQRAAADREEKARVFLRIIETLSVVIENMKTVTNATVAERTNRRLSEITDGAIHRKIHEKASELAAAKGNFEMGKYRELVKDYLRTKTYYEEKTSDTAKELQRCLDEHWCNIEEVIAIKNPRAFRESVERAVEAIASNPTGDHQKDIERLKKSLSLASDGSIQFDSRAFEPFYRDRHPDVPSSIRGSLSSGYEPDVPTSARQSYATDSSL